MPILSVVKSLVLFVSSYWPFWVFVEVTSKYSFPDFPSTIPVPRSPFLVLVTSHVWDFVNFSFYPKYTKKKYLMTFSLEIQPFQIIETWI